jgi:hypothetical protein
MWVWLAPSKGPPYMHVIRAYFHYFVAVLRYHNTQTALRMDKKKKTTKSWVVCVLYHLLSCNMCLPRLEALRGGRSNEALCRYVGRHGRVWSGGLSQPCVRERPHRAVTWGPHPTPSPPPHPPLNVILATRDY